MKICNRIYVNSIYKFSLGFWVEPYGFGINYGWNRVLRFTFLKWDFCIVLKKDG
jgi:hypothetical protein